MRRAPSVTTPRQRPAAAGAELSRRAREPAERATPGDGHDVASAAAMAAWFGPDPPPARWRVRAGEGGWCGGGPGSRPNPDRRGPRRCAGADSHRRGCARGEELQLSSGRRRAHGGGPALDTYGGFAADAVRGVGRDQVAVAGEGVVLSTGGAGGASTRARTPTPVAEADDDPPREDAGRLDGDGPLSALPFDLGSVPARALMAGARGAGRVANLRAAARALANRGSAARFRDDVVRRGSMWAPMDGDVWSWRCQLRVAGGGSAMKSTFAVRLSTRCWAARRVFGGARGRCGGARACLAGVLAPVLRSNRRQLAHRVRFRARFGGPGTSAVNLVSVWKQRWVQGWLRLTPPPGGLPPSAGRRRNLARPRSSIPVIGSTSQIATTAVPASASRSSPLDDAVVFDGVSSGGVHRRGARWTESRSRRRSRRADVAVENEGKLRKLTMVGGFSPLTTEEREHERFWIEYGCDDRSGRGVDRSGRGARAHHAAGDELLGLAPGAVLALGRRTDGRSRCGSAARFGRTAESSISTVSSVSASRASRNR